MQSLEIILSRAEKLTDGAPVLERVAQLGLMFSVLRHSIEVYDKGGAAQASAAATALMGKLIDRGALDGFLFSQPHLSVEQEEKRQASSSLQQTVDEAVSDLQDVFASAGIHGSDLNVVAPTDEDLYQQEQRAAGTLPFGHMEPPSPETSASPSEGDVAVNPGAGWSVNHLTRI
jgi:hypothetical protein